MFTVTQAAPVRRWMLAFLFVAGAATVQPAFAACNPGSYKVNPNKQTVQEFNAGAGYAPTLVTLGLNKPLDPGATVAWVQTGGPTVTLNTSNPQAVTFLTPSLTNNSVDLTFRATVTCPAPDGSASDVGTVTVLNTNRPPTVFAQTSKVIANVGDAITLTSTGTNDPDGDTPLFYQWTQTAGPSVTLAGATTATASFTAPTSSGNYTLQFQLAVRDRNTGGLTGTATVVVNVTVNLPPLARLSCPEQVNEHGNVLLDGSTSSDPNGGPLTYQWTQLQGSPSIQVGAETGNTVQFTAPALTTGQDGFLEFRLKVTDSTSLFDLATCWVQIVDVTAPVISPPADITAEADSASGKSVSYTVYAQDAVDDPLPYILNTCTPASGSTFGLATAPTKALKTPVSCTAQDTAGNIATGGFNVTVQDTTAPTLTVPGAFGVEATDANGAIASFAVSASDTVDGIIGPDCNHASGDLFPLGDTTVACSATDARQNTSATKSFIVSVIDTTDPVVVVPTDIVKEAASPQGTHVSFVVTASDTVSGPLSPVCIIGPDQPVQSGELFPLGVSTLSCSATDGAGNTGSASFTITVQDTIAPTIDGDTGDQTIEATSPDGAVANFVLTATDVVDTEVLVECTPASGSTFDLGTTPVHCTATDDSHNTATADFSITVQDTTAPDITGATGDQTLEATSPAGAVATYVLAATDIVDTDVVVVCTPASGTTFGLGTTPVHCTATDDSDNTATADFSIKVQDTTAPSISGDTGDQTLEATSAAGAVASYALAATDTVDTDVVVLCTPASGSTFGLGTTPVHCTATDDSLNTATADFSIKVQDTTAPGIAAHGPVDPVEATSAAGAKVTYVAPATSDIVDGAGTASCLPPSGATFALGTTAVHCRAQDAAGNHATPTSFDVTVVDTTAPVIAPHATVTAEATSAGGAVVTYLAPATSDAVDGAGTASCLPASGSQFALGNTTVHCRAQDAHGNQAAPTSFVVSVVDTTAPVISGYADVYVNATGNSSAVATWPTPTATDAVSGNVAVTCVPPSGSTFPVGATTVNCSATDGAGNTGHGSFEVEVGYGFTGFFRPVDNAPTINVVKAGSAIPVKFSLGANQGLNIFATGYPASVSAQCNAALSDAIEETVTAGNSSLSYDATAGQYVYVWKTEKSWTGCRQLQVKLRDGRSYWAIFNFTR